MTISPEQLHILQHSLGLDKYGQGDMYRNNYAVYPEGSSWKDLLELTRLGLMEQYGGVSWSRMVYFSVTEVGINYVKNNSPKPPATSISKKRYRDYLKVADCFKSFGDYLRYKEYRKKEYAEQY